MRGPDVDPHLALSVGALATGVKRSLGQGLVNDDGIRCQQTRGHHHHATEEDGSGDDPEYQGPVIECTTEETSLTGAALSDSVKLLV
jgi:hypothetical protein